MSHENAPATLLLATHCACCGRALVDAVSVETGIGPECRKRFGTDIVVDESAREEANELVFQVARKGMTAEKARAIFDRLAALGFVVLADRIAKRFRAAVTKSPSLEELRAEYAAIRADYCYDNCSPKEFNEHIAQHFKGKSPTAAEYVAAAKTISCPCRRCASTGLFVVGTVNGKPNCPGGECFRCAGKGRQTIEDVRRNRAFDRHNMVCHARVA